MGPILFLIFINDIDSDITNWILKFADDTKMFGLVCNTSDYMKFQEDLNRLLQWIKTWQISFNVDKCKIMHFKQANKTCDYSLDCQPLTRVSEEKNLGITISIKLEGISEMRINIIVKPCLQN